MNKKEFIGKVALTNKILSDDNDSLRKNNRILLDERNEYMELTEKQRQMIIQLEKENKELRKKELRLDALESAIIKKINRNKWNRW